MVHGDLVDRWENYVWSLENEDDLLSVALSVSLHLCPAAAKTNNSLSTSSNPRMRARVEGKKGRNNTYSVGTFRKRREKNGVHFSSSKDDVDFLLSSVGDLTR